MKIGMTAAASLAFFGAASVGLAQTTWLEIDDEALMVAPMNLSVDAIEDMDVYSADGERIGEVEEVLGSAQGKPSAVALEVGGFLGVGEREVIVPLDMLAMREDRMVLDMTKEQVDALENWDR